MQTSQAQIYFNKFHERNRLKLTSVGKRGRNNELNEVSWLGM